MRSPLPLLPIALLCASSSTLAAPPRPGPPREPEASERRGPDREPDLRRARRDPEGGGGSVRTADELTREQSTLTLLWREGGCAIDGHARFVAALLAADNPSDAMSLEVWGDSHEYVPYQKVYYYMRVPRAAYVTLFWIGPKNDIFIPFQNLRIPADRDVSVDPESIIVPPLGREQWVAVASLEPLPFPCYGVEAAHLGWLERLRRLPHGVGRWEVRSKSVR